MNPALLLAAWAVAWPTLAVELDFTGFPPQARNGPTTALAVYVYLADGTSRGNLLEFFESPGPAGARDAAADVFRHPGWKARRRGLTVLIGGTETARACDVTVKANGPAPAVRWVLAPEFQVPDAACLRRHATFDFSRIARIDHTLTFRLWSGGKVFATAKVAVRKDAAPEAVREAVERALRASGVYTEGDGDRLLVGGKQATELDRIDVDTAGPTGGTVAAPRLVSERNALDVRIDGVKETPRD